MPFPIGLPQWRHVRPATGFGKRMRVVSALLLVLGAGSPAANAQEPEVLVLRCEPALDHMTTKQVYEVVQGFDPNGKVLMAADRVELVLASAVPAQEVIDALNGLGPVHFHRMFLDPAAERTVSTAPPADLPVFIDTGDPVADEEAHAAAKQAWLIAHPEFYNRPLPKAAR